MLLGMDLLVGLFIVWCVVTGLLIVLAIYRSLWSSREEDVLFLDRAEQHMEREQTQVIRKVQKLSPYVNLLGVVSLLLFLVIAGMWLWRGWTAQP